MKIRILAVGAVKEKSFIDAIKEYSKRLTSYVNLEIIEVSDEPIDKKCGKTLNQVIKEKEGNKLLKHIKEQDYVILLDLHESKEEDSIMFAKHLDNLMTKGKSVIDFVIGGSLGNGENIRKRANERLSLSKMTFTHQMTRLILLEQIYRAFKINNNETYHK